MIDGLDKSQWFWGKAILVVLVGLFFLTTKLFIGAGAAALGTDFSAADGPIVPSSVYAATGALFLAYLSSASLGLLCAVTIRNSGPAIAVWFFWITLGEQLLPGRGDTDDVDDRMVGEQAGQRFPHEGRIVDHDDKKTHNVIVRNWIKTF